MWPFKNKEIKIIKIGEILNFSERGETLLELGIPINRNIERYIVLAHHKDKCGNIFEFEVLLDLENEKVTKIRGKQVYYAPLMKRLRSKIIVISISLIIGIILTLAFHFDIILYMLGILTFVILEEFFIKRINKKYENSHDIKNTV